MGADSPGFETPLVRRIFNNAEFTQQEMDTRPSRELGNMMAVNIAGTSWLSNSYFPDGNDSLCDSVPTIQRYQ